MKSLSSLIVLVKVVPKRTVAVGDTWTVQTTNLSVQEHHGLANGSTSLKLRSYREKNPSKTCSQSKEFSSFKRYY